MNAKLPGMIGLAKRAGKLVSGTDTVMRLIRSGKAKMVLLDRGASENSKKQITDKCETYKVTLCELDEGLLDAAIGESGRMTAAINDEQFAKTIGNLI